MNGQKNIKWWHLNLQHDGNNVDAASNRLIYMIKSNNVYQEWTEGNWHDTSEVINMIGYIAHTWFGTLDSMNEGNRQLQVCSVIRQSAWSWRVIRVLFVKWVIVNRTRNCSELSGLLEDIARDFKFIDVGNRKIKHCYIHTATVLLSVHAMQIQQAVEGDRE